MGQLLMGRRASVYDRLMLRRTGALIVLLSAVSCSFDVAELDPRDTGPIDSATDIRMGGADVAIDGPAADAPPDGPPADAMIDAPPPADAAADAAADAPPADAAL